MNDSDLRVLMMSGDRNILVPESAVSKRMAEYGALVSKLHIVVFTDKSHGFRSQKISDNVWVYPTNSANKFLRPLDAVKIGESIECDMITAQDPFECGWSGMKLKFKKNVPLEVQLHTDLYSSNFSGILNFARKVIAKKVLKNADAVRVVAAYLKSRIKHPNVYVLPIFVDRSRIAGESKFDLHQKFGFDNVVLAVSRVSAEKNIGLAIRSVAQIPNTGLVIVGDGAERAKFRESEKVKFVGWQEDLASFYKTADIFIQTSKFEGYGLSLVEAGLSALPVVTTPVGIAKDLKNVIVAKSESDFTSAVLQLVQDPERKKSLGAKLQEELNSIVLTKEEYLRELKNNWVNLAK